MPDKDLEAADGEADDQERVPDDAAPDAADGEDGAEVAVETVVLARAGAEPLTDTPLRITIDPTPDGSVLRARFTAQVDDGKPFFIGRGVPYKGRFGLQNEELRPGLLYSVDDYAAVCGHWAELIDATVVCESHRSFVCLNSYDRAAFTFGALQFAAHVAGGDFVTFLHRLLEHAEAPLYFPDLQLKNGRIFGPGGALETADSTAGLMAYLNPDPQGVGKAECEAAARLTHWTATYRYARDLQVDVGLTFFKSRMAELAARMPMNGRADFVCSAAIDILHQGRGRYADIKAALASSGSEDGELEALLAVGHDVGRSQTLRGVIADKRKHGRMGAHVWDASAGDWRPRSPAVATTSGWTAPSSALFASSFAAELADRGPAATALALGNAAAVVAPEPPGGPSASAFRDSVVRYANQEWVYFQQQEIDTHGHVTHRGGQEGDPPFSEHIREYWKVIGESHSGAEHDFYWSAVFVSWVMEQAGAGTRWHSSSQHSVYIHWAIRNLLDARPGAGFLGYRIEDVELRPGDVIGRAREGVAMTYDHAAQLANYPGHCDIVVEVTDDYVRTIGGNVRQSVSRTTRRTSRRGRMTSGAGGWFVALRPTF